MSTINRCQWAGEDPLYIKYHDEEWGSPVHEDKKHLEFIILEGAQAGLSWLTVLKKRQGYIRIFHKFDVTKVANMTDTEIELALKDNGIIRNRLKVNSAVNNAKIFITIQEEFESFDKYIWSFVGGETIKNNWKSLDQLPAKSEISDEISKDLKKRGMSFVGSTIIYAYMQACGLVNDHLITCFRYGK